MKSKAIVPLILGLGMGFMAIKMGMNLIQKAQAGASDTLPVVVAARPIDAASRIDKAMLKVAQVPKALVPPGCFDKVEAVHDRVSFMQMATGMPVSAEMLAPIGTEPGLPSQIPEGYRAISVRTDEASAVAGFVMPGHRVDIYAVDARVQRGAGVSHRPVSRMLLEDVQVAAVGQSTKSVDPDGKSTHLTGSVTLYVKPDDLPALDVASRETIRLVLRGSREPGQAFSGVRDKVAKSFESLMLGFERQAKEAEARAERMAQRREANASPVKVVIKASEPARPRTHVMEVVRGTEVERITFGGPRLNERMDSQKKERSQTQ